MTQEKNGNSVLYFPTISKPRNNNRCTIPKYNIIHFTRTLYMLPAHRLGIIYRVVVIIHKGN